MVDWKQLKADTMFFVCLVGFLTTDMYAFCKSIIDGDYFFTLCVVLGGIFQGMMLYSINRLDRQNKKLEKQNAG